MIRLFTSLKWRCRPGGEGNALWLALVMGFSFGGYLGAADLRPLTNSTLELVTVPLEYKETSYRIVNRSVSWVPHTNRFNGESAEVGDKTYRGMLNFEGHTASSLAFVWQKGAGKLYLDLNRNLDFADDTNGVFTVNTKGNSYSQSFTGVRLPVAPGLSGGQILADFDFWDYGSRPSISLALRSFWQGRVVLHGQEWEMGLVGDALNQIEPQGRSELLVRPWEQRNQSFSADGQLPDTVMPTIWLWPPICPTAGRAGHCKLRNNPLPWEN
jgi:hypothetical protein